VRNSDARVPFTIKVIDSEEVNAFSIPGGFLYVNAGLILAADNEAELAGAMAHEIAHIAARHATRQMTRSNLVSILSIPLIFVGGGVGMALQGMVGVGTPLAFTKFSRAFEAEADYLGLEYLYQTGYDPEALISFFEKLQAMEHDKPGALARAFASHPQTGDRVKKSQAEIARILPVRDQYVVTTSDFEVMKARLSEIEENRHRSQDRPMLRRRVAASSNTDSDKSADDTDRPVLKRREQK
jgi:predicted Zn-dependent protease